GWVEISQMPSTPVTIAVTRVTITGSRIEGDVAVDPGGPPDYKTAVSTVDFKFPASTGFTTTPTTCPAGGQWVTTATFSFADGTTQHASGSTPCTTSTSASEPPRPPSKHYARGRRHHRKKRHAERSAPGSRRHPR